MEEPVHVEGQNVLPVEFHRPPERPLEEPHVLERDPDQVEERLEVPAFLLHRELRDTIPGDGVDDGNDGESHGEADDEGVALDVGIDDAPAQAEPGRGQRQGDAPADAGGCTRDQGGLFLQRNELQGFPGDIHGLYFFDGTHLYEYADMRRGYQDVLGVRVGGEIFFDAMGTPGQIEDGYDLGTYEGMIKHNLNTIVNALK